MMRPFANAAVCLITALTLLGHAGPAAAKPTEAQLDAIKANCRSDFMSNCWGVKRGGVEAMQCLKEHMASLSPGCQTAVKAITAAPAPARAPTPAPAPAKPEAAPAPVTTAPEPAAPATPEPEQEAAPVQEPETKSASPAPQENAPTPAPKAPSAPPPTASAPEIAPPAKAEKTEAPAAPETSGGTPEDAPAIIGFIPPRKKLMVLRNCRQDLETYCPDVSYGGGRQLHCLFSNKAALTSDCQGALAKLTR